MITVYGLKIGNEIAYFNNYNENSNLYPIYLEREHTDLLNTNDYVTLFHLIHGESKEDTTKPLSGELQINVMLTKEFIIDINRIFDHCKLFVGYFTLDSGKLVFKIKYQ